MTEAIVMDGGKRGQVVKVCADPACRVHHPNTPSPQQVERERTAERKRIEKEKLAITTRHRVLATVLQRVSAPLKKADLLAVAHYLIGHLSYRHVPALAKRHKVEAKQDSASAQELLVEQVGTYDEAELCKLFCGMAWILNLWSFRFKVTSASFSIGVERNQVGAWKKVLAFTLNTCG